MDVQFRIAEYSDIEGIVKLCNKVFEENSSLDFAKNVFNATKNDRNQIYVVGELNGVIVAHLKITIIPTIYEKMNTYAIFNHVCVDPDFRRNHIASRMLQYSERLCKNKGCKTVELWSMNFRVPAHECYKRDGFVVEDAKFFSKKI